jgi:hypothetical protein
MISLSSTTKHKFKTQEVENDQSFKHYNNSFKSVGHLQALHHHHLNKNTVFPQRYRVGKI